MLRRLLALLPLALLGAGSASAAVDWKAPSLTAQKPPLLVGGPTFVVTGHGWGHGVGMPQWGAYGYARHGFGYARIIAHYFPGTTLGPAPVTKVRVLLSSGVRSVTIGSAARFKVRDATGRSYPVSGTVTFGPGLKLKLDPAKPAKALQGPLAFTPGTAPLQLGDRRYRGSLQVDVPGGLRVINVIGLEAYLYGVVPSEMPHTWSSEALKCQAVVARSYALAVRKTGPFDLYADTRSQVYLGIDHEFPASTAAVDATAGQVLLYGVAVAKTYFYSSSGGRTAAITDVWPKAEPVPYLVSVTDPYDTISPYHTWGPFAFTAAKLDRALKVPGRLLDVQTELNGSGRIAAVVASGTGGSVTVPGTALRARLGLRSTWFTLGELGLAAPEPRTAVYGSRVLLGGIARGVVQTALQARIGSEPWSTIATVGSGKEGVLSLAVRPSRTTSYRLSSGPAVSQPVQAAVAPALRFFVNADSTALRGSERPVLAGASVAVQRLVGSTWKTVSTVKVDGSGAFTLKMPTVAGTYRARFAPGHGLVAATSAPVKVLTA